MEQALVIIKPDSVNKNRVGSIIDYFEREGLSIVAMRMCSLTEEEAKDFYREHKGQDFFERLIRFTTSGPVVPIILEGENAVARARKVIGSTEHEKAMPDTIRRRYAEALPSNAIHGSDSVENAKREMAFFFGKDSIFARQR